MGPAGPETGTLIGNAGRPCEPLSEESYNHCCLSNSCVGGADCGSSYPQIYAPMIHRVTRCGAFPSIRRPLDGCMDSLTNECSCFITLVMQKAMADMGGGHGEGEEVHCEA